MTPVDFPWLIYSQNMHYILPDHFGLNFVVTAHHAFYSALLLWNCIEILVYTLYFIKLYRDVMQITWLVGLKTLEFVRNHCWSLNKIGVGLPFLVVLVSYAIVFRILDQQQNLYQSVSSGQYKRSTIILTLCYFVFILPICIIEWVPITINGKVN